MKQKRRSVLIMTILGIVSYSLFGSLCPILAQEQTPGSNVASLEVIQINGSAQFFSRAAMEKRKDQMRTLGATVPENWMPVRPQTSLNEGDQFRTGLNSTVELKLSDGTVVTLSGETRIMVEKLRSARSGMAQTAEIRLEEGTLKTTQPLRILGQTFQRILTNNGAINTQLGEVEVSKFGGNGTLEENRTLMVLLRGTSEIVPGDEGYMNAESHLIPDSCGDEDGVSLMLKAQHAPVNISKLPEANGFRLASVEDFTVFVGTDGTANHLTFETKSSPGFVDVEGRSVAEMRNNAKMYLGLNEVLTAGFTGRELSLSLGCKDLKSKGLADLEIQSSGDVNIVRTNLGGRPVGGNSPSLGAVVPTTGIATPTPTPVTIPGQLPPGLPDTLPVDFEEEDVEEEVAVTEDEDDEESVTTTATATPTPTPTPAIVVPVYPPVTIPNALTTTSPTAGTHNITSSQTISCSSTVNSSVACGLGTCEIDQSCVTASFVWAYPAADIEGGAVYIYDGGTPPGPPTCDSLIAARYINSTHPGDTVQVQLVDTAGTIQITFCGPSLCTSSHNYSVRVTDNQYGEISPCQNAGNTAQFTAP